MASERQQRRRRKLIELAWRRLHIGKRWLAALIFLVRHGEL